MEYDQIGDDDMSYKVKEVANWVGVVIHYSCESFYDIKNGKTPRII